MNPEQRAHALAIADELLAEIELDQLPIDKQVLKASRLARLVGDEKVSDWLYKERFGYNTDDKGTYYWVATRRGGDEKNPVYAGALQIAAMARTLENELANMNLPNVSGDSAWRTMKDVRDHIANVRNRVIRLQGMLSSISMFVHDFASRQYHALKFTQSQEQLFERAKSNIDSLLEGLEVETLRKIDAAQSNLRLGDPESIAGAMLNVRRLIDSFADAVFPPTTEVRTNGQGQEIKLGPEQRLNRAKAYVDDHSVSDSRAGRLKRSLGDVYARVSAGVHSDVSLQEAEHLFLTTYVLLGEILGLRNEEPSDRASVTVPGK
ncbi:hypothetical protein ACFVJS_14150 [Nocardioides sp. NPDC057772]|uniref:AbiTii domain-containing protein n=1 Tax=Nocardioides sp. NPDC057772 TaxID=3346245 RepID=UPI00366D7269